MTAIKTLLKRGPVGLRAHRGALEDKRARLDRAIAALDEIQHDAKPRAALRRFMADAAWERWETKRKRAAVARHPDRAPASAITLFREIAAVLDADGKGPGSQALVTRCRDVIAPETRGAWRRRAGWPSGLRRYVASCYEMEPAVWERVVAFIEAHGTR